MPGYPSSCSFSKSPASTASMTASPPSSIYAPSTWSKAIWACCAWQKALLSTKKKSAKDTGAAPEGSTGVYAVTLDTGYTNPRSANDTQLSPPTTTWSMTRISTRAKASFSRWVMRRSASLGSGSPLGWLWTLCAPFPYVPHRSNRSVLPGLLINIRPHNGRPGAT